MVEIRWINSKNWRFWPYNINLIKTLDLINNRPYKSEKKFIFPQSGEKGICPLCYATDALIYNWTRGISHEIREYICISHIYSSWKNLSHKAKNVLLSSKKRIYYDICLVNFVLQIPKKTENFISHKK